jgi:hypothetical protein
LDAGVELLPDPQPGQPAARQADGALVLLGHQVADRGIDPARGHIDRDRHRRTTL